MSRAAARAKAAPKEPAAEGTAAKAAAYRPSKGRYPKRQFGHRRGFPKPTEEDITKVKLNRTKEIHVQYARRGPGNAGARNFKHEKIPIIKHWNSSVAFKVKMTETDPPQVTVVTEGNATETFNVESLRADAILELVVKHDQAQAKKAPKEAAAEKV